MLLNDKCENGSHGSNLYCVIIQTAHLNSENGWIIPCFSALVVLLLQKNYTKTLQHCFIDSSKTRVEFFNRLFFGQAHRHVDIDKIEEYFLHSSSQGS